MVTIPFSMFNFGQILLPYISTISLIILITSAIFVILTTAVLFYHWWRYSDNQILTLITIGTYTGGSLLLLLIMFFSI
jgi:hypothetical protein